MNTTGPVTEAVEDVISSLPENVLSQILQCLPLHDAARSSVLSKPWRYTWLSLPKLTFDSKFYEDLLKKRKYYASKFGGVVSMVLLHHVGPVTKFDLYIPGRWSIRCNYTLVAPCLSYLSRNSVKEIKLQNSDFISVKVPSYLFSCVHLEKLQLKCFMLDHPSSFKGFSNLVHLELENIFFVGNSFKNLINCCPQLETVTLLNWNPFKCVSVNAPKVKYFTLSGRFGSVWLSNPQNLISLSITMERMVLNICISTSQDLITLVSMSSKLEKLFLTGYTCKTLAAGGFVSKLRIKYKCLKVLQLSNIEANNLNEFKFVVAMIKSCPVVEVLKISFSSTISAEHEIGDTVSCSLDHLREIEFASVKGYSMELKLIEYLLMYSTVLHKFYVKRGSEIEANLEAEMARQLIRFRRASSKAEVIYLDPKT